MGLLLGGTVDGVKKRDIAHFISCYVPLNKFASGYSADCPFCEKENAFRISQTKQLYHCVSCKDEGDLISFAMHASGLSFGEVVDNLDGYLSTIKFENRMNKFERRLKKREKDNGD